MPSSFFPSDGPHAAFRSPWVPARVSWLLLTEAPPPYEAGRYFYRPYVPKGDSLFLETIKLLFAEEVQAFPSVKAIRRDKPYFLNRLKESGFLLAHGVETPLPNTTATQREHVYQDALPALQERLLGLGVTKETPIVIVSAVVHKAIAQGLADAGFTVANLRQPIPYPNSGQQANTRRLLGPLLLREGLMPDTLSI